MQNKNSVSIIIPVYNEEKCLNRCLKNLRNLGADEIILVDGGSNDRTLQIAKEFPEVKIFTSGKGRSAQMNLGAREASGEILLFLHADSILGKAALEKIKYGLQQPHVLAGSFFLKFDYENFWLKTYSFFSRINHSMFTYGDQGLFIWKECFNTLGGFQDMRLLEDLEIQQRIRRSGKFIKLHYPIITSARRFRQGGIIWQQVKNIIIVSLYLVGVPSSRLAKYYKIGIR